MYKVFCSFTKKNVKKKKEEYIEAGEPMNYTSNETTAIEALLQLQSGVRKIENGDSKLNTIALGPHIRICPRCNMSWTWTGISTHPVHNVTKMSSFDDAKIMVQPDAWQYENMRITPNIALQLSSEICIIPSDVVLWLEWSKQDGTKGKLAFSHNSCNLVRSESAIMFFDIILPSRGVVSDSRESPDYIIMIKLGEKIFSTRAFKIRASLLQPWMMDSNRTLLMTVPKSQKPRKKPTNTIFLAT